MNAKAEKPVRVIDAANLILGRMCTSVAKGILAGEEIAVVNAEKAVVSGKWKMVIGEHKKEYKSGNKLYGPRWPKRPDQFVRRSIRGMIPWKNTRGREAFKNVKVYIGVPEELKGQELEVIENAKLEKLGTLHYVRIEEICKQLGGVE